LSVARSRHYYYFDNGQWNYDGMSDLSRIKRQDAFLKALIDSAKSKYNPLTINAFIGSLPQGIEIDSKFTLSELVGLAVTFHNFSPNDLISYTLPWSLATGAAANFGGVLIVDQPAAQQMLVQIFGNELTTPTTPPPNDNLEPNPPPVISSSSTTGTTGSSSSTNSSGISSATSSASATTATTTPADANTSDYWDPTPC
jgi:anionic cell wall polymer biosynthesis LytR-Cps2A-Psr (LCP) family protein